MKTFETMQAWLRNVTSDQNLEDIDELTDTIVNHKKRWWPSRVLQPTLKQGKYNNSTGKYELEDAGVNTVRYTTGSSDTDTLTCAVGSEYEVLFVTAVDGVTASSYVLSLDVSGAFYPLIPDDVNVAIGETRVLVGPAFQPDAAGNLHSAIPGGLIKLRAGDQMRIVNQDFVVLDATTYIWIYRVRSV